MRRNMHTKRFPLIWCQKHKQLRIHTIVQNYAVVVNKVACFLSFFEIFKDFHFFPFFHFWIYFKRLLCARARKLQCFKLGRFSSLLIAIKNGFLSHQNLCNLLAHMLDGLWFVCTYINFFVVAYLIFFACYTLLLGLHFVSFNLY